jgi:hypothetical protein
MRVSKKGGGKVSINIGGQVAEQVTKFKYLGSYITEEARCEQEIKTRIAVAKEAFSNRRELLVRNMSKKVKKKIIKCLVWSVLLYGSETWTLNKEAVNRLEAMEMWIWRRMEKIKWTDKKKNVEVLDMVNERRQLITVIKRRKRRWIGHVLRGDGMLREVMEGRMNGERGRGRPRLGMLEEMKVDFGVEVENGQTKYEGWFGRMKRCAENRSQWRAGCNGPA